MRFLAKILATKFAGGGILKLSRRHWVHLAAPGQALIEVLLAQSISSSKLAAPRRSDGFVHAIKSSGWLAVVKLQASFLL